MPRRCGGVEITGACVNHGVFAHQLDVTGVEPHVEMDIGSLGECLPFGEQFAHDRVEHNLCVSLDREEVVDVHERAQVDAVESARVHRRVLCHCLRRPPRVEQQRFEQAARESGARGEQVIASAADYTSATGSPLPDAADR